jgi:hypothetical protein
MVQGSPNGKSTKPSGLVARLGTRGIVAVVVGVLVVSAIALWVLIPRRAVSPPASSVPSSPESSGTASISTSAPASINPSLTASSTTPAQGSGSGSVAGPGSKKPAPSKPSPPPSPSKLKSLKSGEWLLYDSELDNAGTPISNGKQTDIGGIALVCKAVTLVGGKESYATFACSYSASGPLPGKSGTWDLFGTWTLSPDATSKGSHYVSGLQGAIRGTTTTKPPSADGRMIAGMSPIGAYRAGGAITSGTFRGSTRFEGVLALPSVGTPPAPGK